MGNYLVLGLMSGTSLDGLDLALCHFQSRDGNWQYRIIQAETWPYPEDLRKDLAHCQSFNGEELIGFHARYGHYLGRQSRLFLDRHGLKADFISSHGHTVFHRPDDGFTFQVGSGSHLMAGAGLPVVCDFRSQDVAFGGQGAPLVPIGDELLFGAFGACLNLGGFANVSFRKQSQRVAFDICPVNFVLNRLVAPLGLEMDKDGHLASQGTVDSGWLAWLAELEYFSQTGPKSLGREWVESQLSSILAASDLSVEDRLRTYCEFVGGQVAGVLDQSGADRVLVTGGGAYNRFLMDLIRAKTRLNVAVPEPQIVEFKEALIFAFLGLLKWLELPNCLASVPGAPSDHSSGQVYRT